jgi:aspartyl-tRNA(Asn)/glutamyl-tRNA(Gln) amidotransferase subunit A
VEAFRRVDLIAAPTTPSVAWRVGELADDPLSIYLADIFTIPANLAGICGMSVPCGSDGGLPVGLQLMAPSLGEALLLRAGRAVEG